MNYEDPALALPNTSSAGSLIHVYEHILVLYMHILLHSMYTVPLVIFMFSRIGFVIALRQTVKLDITSRRDTLHQFVCLLLCKMNSRNKCTLLATSELHRSAVDQD